MPPKRSNRSADAVLANIPNFLDRQDEVFNSAEELEMSLRYLNRILSVPTNADNDSSYLIDKIEVEFQIDLSADIVRIDHANTRLVICLPRVPNEDPASVEKRRADHLLRYSSIIEELRMRALIIAYRSLSKSSRKKLVQIESERQRARKKR